MQQQLKAVQFISVCTGVKLARTHWIWLPPEVSNDNEGEETNIIKQK